MSLTEQVRNKIDEYGIEIYNDYPTTDSEYVFFVEDMVLFVNEKTKTVGASFQACTRPERVANIVMILNEMKIDIDVMDSFVFDKENKYISGEKAYKLIDETHQSEIIQNFLKQQAYRELLINSDGHKC